MMQKSVGRLGAAKRPGRAVRTCRAAHRACTTPVCHDGAQTGYAVDLYAFSAYTRRSVDPMYTTPSTTTGEEAIGLPVWNDQHSLPDSASRQ